MSIFLAFAIVAIAAIAITYKTYMGYAVYPWYTRLAFFIFIVLGWTAPILSFIIRKNSEYSALVGSTKILYFIFGFVFLLFVISFIRDFIWMIVDFIRRTPIEQIKNPPHITKVNLATFVFTLLLSLYGVYEAEKTPNIVEHNISSPKIKEKTKVVMLSDLHIDTDVSTKYIKNIIDVVKKQNPDFIVLVGDIVDNEPGKLYAQTETLKILNTKNNVYVALGNHEHYSDALNWIISFGRMGFNILGNLGQREERNGIYFAGIPDINAAQQDKIKINLTNTLYNANKDDYVILLSHTPKVAEGVTKDNVDLILSGHTHGGQIYPFHHFVKKSNEGRLAGFYDIDGVKMYVSRGTRYWGPPMRIFAPSEITVFNFIPENNDAKNN
jgi:predicted MPP superfamily phosphohydrolase